MNHIENAVAPLKALAMDAAEAFAKRIIAATLATLDAANGDAQIAAPFPRSTVSRADYQKAYSKYLTLRSITANASPSCRSPRDPEPRVRSEAKEAEFIAEAREQAAASYIGYVRKLVTKVGACDAAELVGNYVWSLSILNVTKGATVERWKTQQIINVSKLGKVFNQWPTRLLKGSK